MICKPAVTAAHADARIENDAGNSLSSVKMQEDASKPKHTPSIIDQLSRTKTKEEIANQKKARAQALEKVKSGDEPTPAVEAPRGRDPSQVETTASTTASTAAPTAAPTTASTKPKHPDDERPSMALAPKCTCTSPMTTQSISPR